MDDKNVIIARQQKEIQELHALVAELRDKIARLEKNSSNSSKPPSSDIVDPQLTRKKKKKRKIGGQKGHPKHTRRPFSQDEVDRVVIHKIPAEEIRRRGLVPLDETEVALQQVDLSLSRFKSKFRQQVGLPPGEYILREKVKRAEELLRETEVSVTSIAYRLGFSSSQYFATAFKRFTHTRPSDVRTSRT